MADVEKTAESLRRKGYEVSCFETGEEAARYLDGKIDGFTVGFGDSETLLALGMYDRLSKHNDSSLDYNFFVWVNADDYWDVYFDLLEQVKTEFDKNGFSIPFKQIDIHQI